MIAAYLLTSCTWSGVRQPTSTEIKGKHYVVTLHGVRGNDQSYGDFHKIVKDNLQRLDPSYQVETFNWTYPVGAAVVETVKKNGRDFIWTPQDISKKFNRDFFLSKDAPLKNINPNDKISLIAYSMGGLMAMSWYYDTMYNFSNSQVGKYSKDIHAELLQKLEKVENIIGLGPVYWGSLDAELGWSFLEKGDLSEIKKSIPKLKAMCESSEMKAVVEGSSITKSIGETIAGWFGFGSSSNQTTEQKNEKFVKNSISASCQAINYIDASWIAKNINSVNGTVLSGIQSGMSSYGNMSHHEMDNMRLTSNAINSMRLYRIRHLLSEENRNRFKAKWTSIVGVFPCLGKKDKGSTCTDFVSEDYRRVNDGFVTLFSGLKRRETDGPVMGPSAVADFIFYTERPGNENQKISFNQFYNTDVLQQSAGVKNEEIFVENMHATVVPALEGVSGLFKSVGVAGANAMKNFDASLGVDVVIVNKECSNPKTCEHPNYRHMLQALANCQAGNPTYCDESFMNQYYGVDSSSQRMVDNENLKKELGSFVITMNVRFPKNLKLPSDLKTNPLRYFKFTTVNYSNNPWEEDRADTKDLPYAVQINRKREIISSYSYLKQYGDSQVLSIFFIGRAWPKMGYQAKGSEMLAAGVPVNLSVNIPGVQAREITAKIKPTYTTYIDFYLK